jgi:hypothetical protein
MSDVRDQASLSMLLADYAMTDQLGRLHVLGGGLQVIGRDPNTGMTPAFALVVTMTFPAVVFQEQFVFEVQLEHTSGAALRLPGALGAVADPTAESLGGGTVRFAQNMTVDEPNLSRAGVPRRALPAQHQVVVYFNTGLPLPPGETLVWRASIDGDSQPGWTLPFFVPGPPSVPVVG